jgi:hypothetical protein
LPRFFVVLWRTFKRLLGEEHWEFALRDGREELLESLREQVAGVARWRALSPGWIRSTAHYYGHVGTHEIVVRVYPTSTAPRPLVSFVALYAFVGRIVEGPNGLNLVGDYRVIPVLRQFGMLCFGFLLLTVMIDIVFLANFSFIQGEPGMALRAVVILLGSVFHIAFLRFLVWIPERWDRPFRENLRQHLASLAAGRE